MIPNTLTSSAASEALARRAARLPGGVVVGVSVGGAVFALGFSDGTYGLTQRDAVAIATLWALALTALMAPGALAALRGVAAVPALALAGVGVVGLISTLWTSSAEAAVNAFDKYVLYAAAFAFALVAIRRAHLDAWRDGVSWGIVAVAVVGLLSRLAPSLVTSGNAFAFLPIANVRLSYPVGYWNALAALIALAMPLLLAGAAADRPLRVRALSLMPVPALAAAGYLTSSRGGAVAAGVGVIALVLTSASRWRVLGAAAVAAAGSAAAVAALARHPALVNGPLQSPAAESGRTGVAIEIALACLGAAVVYALLIRAADRLPRPALPERAAAVGLVVMLAAAVVAAHPVRQFDRFRQGDIALDTSPGYVQAHLLSASGNGRWQLWQAALHEFVAHPLAGGGAGSFEPWWIQHRSDILFAQDAHSLYLGALAEYGLVGFAFLVALVAAAAVLAWRALRLTPARRRTHVAGLVAALCAAFAATAVDWVWDVPVVAIAALVVLAALARSVPVRAPRPAHGTAGRSEAAVAIWAAGAVAVAALLYAQAAPLLSQRKLEASYAAVRAGDSSAAYRDALSARDLAPWAASTYLQLALLDEQEGRYARAQNWIQGAIERDPKNWELWLISARLFVKQDGISSARDQLARATALNPLALSPLALKAG